MAGKRLITASMTPWWRKQPPPRQDLASMRLECSCEWATEAPLWGSAETVIFAFGKRTTAHPSRGVEILSADATVSTYG